VARALVGADGVGSFVRRWLGAPRGRFSAQAVEVDTEPLPSDELGTLAFDLSDAELRGYAWDFPTPSPATSAGARDATPLVCRGVYELAAEGAPRRDVGALLERRLREQGARALGPPRRYAERGLCLHEPLGAPGVLLVGEAAGVDPVLGEGIAQAIFYGATAGAHLAASLARGDESLEGYRDVVEGARIGLDLRARALAVPLVYDGARALVERALVGSASLRELGARYFGGERVGRGLVARAALEVALEVGRAALSGPSRPT
jgi:flavin-dependent dehydrogenase